MAQRHQLAHGGAPLLFVELAADAKHRELVMPELLDPLRHAADQNIDQVHGPKALPGAIGAGQQLLRDDLAVAQLRRRQAVVAIAAFWWLKRLAEISEQVGASAVRGFGQTDKRLQLGTRDAL